MPIYAYRCDSCGHEKEVLQKLSDALLTTCPECHGDTLSKQLTAPGFQLKGNGWYATDFKGGPPAKGDEAKAEPAKTETAAVPPCQGGTGSCACH